MEITNGSITFEGVPASVLAQEVGTPLYVFERQKVEARYMDFFEAIAHRPLEVLYSVKAHASVYLLRVLREVGAGVDACSLGDLVFAAAAGFPSEKISFAGFSLSQAELDRVLATNAFIVADSMDQVERIGRSRRRSELALRINCGITAGFHPHVQFSAVDSKFGIHIGSVSDAQALAERFDLQVVGLHSHVGSDLLEVEPHLRLLACLLELAEGLPGVRLVDIGGGWGTPFLPEDPDYDLACFGKAVTDMLSDFEERTGRPLALRVEPGAYLVMDAGFLLASVTEIKPAVPTRDGQSPWFACLDTSYNHLHSAVAYDTYHPVWIDKKAESIANQRYHVAGNLMQAGDVLAKDRLLPQVGVGDLVVFGKCGGYKACRSSTFNERGRPAEVMVHKGMATMIREAERPEDLVTGQTEKTLEWEPIDV